MLMAQSVYIGVNVGVEIPIPLHMPVREIQVVMLGLPPYRIELRRDYKGRDVKDEVRKRKAVTFWHHDGITRKNERLWWEPAERKRRR